MSLPPETYRDDNLKNSFEVVAARIIQRLIASNMLAPKDKDERAKAVKIAFEEVSVITQQQMEWNVYRFMKSLNEFRSEAEEDGNFETIMDEAEDALMRNIHPR